MALEPRCEGGGTHTLRDRQAIEAMDTSRLSAETIALLPSVAELLQPTTLLRDQGPDGLAAHMQTLAAQLHEETGGKSKQEEEKVR
jgi:hypothetical protein